MATSSETRAGSHIDCMVGDNGVWQAGGGHGGVCQGGLVVHIGETRHRPGCGRISIKHI